MKIVADENLAFTDYFFADFGEIHQVAGRSLTHDEVQDADALLVRSVTKVDQALIQNTALKFVGSATIGTDHLDSLLWRGRGLLGRMQQNLQCTGCRRVCHYGIIAFKT